MNLPTVIYLNKKPVQITAPEMPKDVGSLMHQRHHDWLQRFVAIIGPRGLAFFCLATGEKWNASGVNAGAQERWMFCKAASVGWDSLKPTDWLARYRSIVID